MEVRKEDQRDPDEKVVEIEIERLRDFKNHPFKVQADSQMKELQESIKKYGILNPLIVRPRPEGFYEIISGHRRKYAAQQLKYTKVPVIIRYMLEEDAIISMVDANLQRERISPSEKAFAYKMKYDVLKRKAGRRKCSQVDYLTGKKSVEVISEECGDSPKQVQRYLKLTRLIPELLEKVDDETMGFTIAVELASLTEKNQKTVLDAMESTLGTPNLSQAIRIKKLQEDGDFSQEKIEELLSNTESNHIISGNDGIGFDVEGYTEIIKENIELDILLERYPYDRELLTGIFDLILETVLCKNKSIVVASSEYPAELVRSKFLKLNMFHVEYAMDCMRKNTSKIHNIKKYLLAALFNAPSTISGYYQAEVNHDLPQYAANDK